VNDEAGVTAGAPPAAGGGTAEAALGPAEAIARVRAILAQLGELEPRLGASASGEVEMTLLERATELVEEAGRLLERLGRVAG
jgi:hypothetical protein